MKQSNLNAASRTMTGGVAVMVIMALAGLASGACPPEEASAGADDVTIVDGFDNDALRVRTFEALPVVGMTDELTGRPMVNIVAAPERVVCAAAGVTGVSSRTSVYNFKWTGKDAGSGAQEVQAEYKDGQWTVKVDGKEVPRERFSTENDVLVVKDEAGKEIFRAPVQVDDGDSRALAPRGGSWGVGRSRGVCSCAAGEQRAAAAGHRDEPC